MGVVRLLDAGTLSLEQLGRILDGQDLSQLTDIWNSDSKAAERRRRR